MKTTIDFPLVPNFDQQMLLRESDGDTINATGAQVQTNAEVASSILVRIRSNDSRSGFIDIPLTLKAATDLSRHLKTAVKHQLGLDVDIESED